MERIRIFNLKTGCYWPDIYDNIDHFQIQENGSFHITGFINVDKHFQWKDILLENGLPFSNLILLQSFHDDIKLAFKKTKTNQK